MGSKEEKNVDVMSCAGEEDEKRTDGRFGVDGIYYYGQERMKIACGPSSKKTTAL